MGAGHRWVDGAAKIAGMPIPSRRRDLLAALTALGGVASTADLVAASSWAALRACTAEGSVVRSGHGVYTLSTCADPALGAPARAWARWHEGPSEAEAAALIARHAIARGRDGALSHLCAASHRGWPILREPSRIDIAVPLGRKTAGVPGQAPVHCRTRDLTAAERADHVTAPIRTVLDCARDLPLVEALAVADSALRCGDVGATELRTAAHRVRGPGSVRARKVAAAADARAANPFESALRAVHLGIPGLSLVPQVEIGGDGFAARVDLADERLRIVIEGDSYAFHGDREAFERTQRRQVELTGRDWVVLPYSFRAVTREPEWVRAATQAVVYVRAERGYGRT